MTKINLGMALPHCGAQASPEGIVAFAQEAERCGYHSLWVIERWFQPVEPVRNDVMGAWEPPAELGFARVLDPLTTLTYVAAMTRRVRLGTSVLAAPLHSPVDLARRLATLDCFSGGRLVAGLGVGWMAEEFAAAGRSRASRGTRMEEFLTVVASVWGPDPVPAFAGSYYQVPAAYIGPKPVQNPPQVLIGTRSPAGAARAGRRGLGFHPVLLSWELFEDLLGTFRKAAADAGHDPDGLPVIVRAPNFFRLSESPVEGRKPLHGSLAQIAQDIARLESSGVGEVVLDISQAGLSTDEQIAQLATLASIA